jgi:hypothetical protein
VPTLLVQVGLSEAEVDQVETLCVLMPDQDVLQLQVVVDVAKLMQLLQPLNLEIYSVSG